MTGYHQEGQDLNEDQEWGWGVDCRGRGRGWGRNTSQIVGVETGWRFNWWESLVEVGRVGWKCKWRMVGCWRWGRMGRGWGGQMWGWMQHREGRDGGANPWMLGCTDVSNKWPPFFISPYFHFLPWVDVLRIGADDKYSGEVSTSGGSV